MDSNNPYKKVPSYEGVYIRRLKEFEKLFNVEGKLEIWLVDGKILREAEDPEDDENKEAKFDGDFVYGGSDMRYTFIPKNEIWIDSETSLAEAIYTVRHELTEREHMEKDKMTYDEAHEIALKAEKPLRRADKRAANKKAKAAKPSAPYIFEIDDPKEPLPWEKPEDPKNES